jgi:ribosomal protein L7/L12
MNWTAPEILVGILLFIGGYFVGRAGKTSERLRQQSRQWTPDPGISDSQIEAAIRAGKKIDAIKLYRQRSGAGLKEAKDAVEAMAQQIQR